MLLNIILSDFQQYRTLLAKVIQLFVSPEKCKNQRFEFLTPDRGHMENCWLAIIKFLVINCLAYWYSASFEIKGILIETHWKHCVVSLSNTLNPLLSSSSTQETPRHGWKIVDWDKQHPGLENSTCLLVFTSASGCRASGILIFLMKITIFPIYSIIFVMQGKCLF